MVKMTIPLHLSVLFVLVSPIRYSIDFCLIMCSEKVLNPELDDPFCNLRHAQALICWSQAQSGCELERSSWYNEKV